MLAPKGVFARAGRDYQVDWLAFGHVDNLSGVNPSAVALYNNANDGTVLGVVAIVIVKNATAGTAWMRMQFGTLGALSGVPSSARLNDRQPVGQFFSGTDPSNPAVNPSNFLALVPSNTSGQFFLRSPIALISPGWSMVISEDSTTHICTNWWFTQLKR